MRARGQLLSALLIVVVVAAAATYLQLEVGTRALPAGPAGVAPSGAWFCPHGGGTEWTAMLQIANPGREAVRIRVTGLSSAKPSGSTAFTVEPGTELLVPAEAESRGASSAIEYFGGWVAAGWIVHGGGGQKGVAAEPCLPEAGRHWYLADGTTREHQEAYVVVMNPFATEANFTLTLFTDHGTPITTEDWTNVVLKPGRSEAFRLNSKALGYGTVSTFIEAKVGRVAAASLGVSDLGGIRSSVGSLDDPGTRIVLPGGFDQGRTDLVVMNPVENAAALDGTLLGSDAFQTLTALQQARPEGFSAQTYPISTEGPSTLDARSSTGVVIARRTYGNLADQASTSGAATAAAAWIILPVVAGPPTHPGLVLANPGDEPAEITLTYLPSNETRPSPAPITVQVLPGRTIAAPESFVEAKPFSAILAIATSGTFVPAAASYSLGQEGVATYAVSLGVPIPDAWVPS
ncbi:MAG: DUF5719 family protein [Actinomycetota bacterium]